MKNTKSHQRQFLDINKSQIRYKPRSSNPVRPLIKSLPKGGRDTNTPTQMVKYQSYLKFIHQDKLTHKKRLSLSKQESQHVIIRLSKTPNLNRDPQPTPDRGRFSVVEKRKPSAKEIPLALQNPKYAQQSKHRKLSVCKDKKNKKSRSKEVGSGKSLLDLEEERAQKEMFNGIQFFRDLGKGAHALVRSAVDWKNNRKVAVKIYHKAALDAEEIDNINREINVLSSISHPNIAVLYDVIKTPKTINLVMEYGGGNSLYQHIRSRENGLFLQEQAKPLFKQIFESIAYLHSKSIVHRDIKPENILLNKAMHVKLIDFGFSLVSRTNEKVDTFCGTPTYMAPEIVNKKKHVGIYADRWSLGVLLYTVLQGVYPFRAANQKQLFGRISKGEYEFIILLSDDVTKLIRSLLRMKPQQRISAEDALKSAWLNGKG